MTPKFLKSLCHLALILLPGILAAQKVDYNTIILPSNAQDISFEEKLVRLAWNNSPNTQILNHQSNIARYDVKLANRQWLSQVSAAGNINEYTINPPANQTFPLFYPRYNFSAMLSLSNIFGDPLKSKRAKEEVQIAAQNINSEKLRVRAEVLRRYQVYLTSIELLKIQTEIASDASNTYDLTKGKFEKGTVTIEQYNLILDNKNAQNSKRVVAQSNVNIAIIDLEELIGVKLEDVQ